MGLGNDTGNTKFITIVNGKWTLRVPEGTDGAVERKLTKGPNAGTAVWEKYYDHIDGELVGGEIKQGQFGTDICIKLRDSEEYTVQIPLESRFFGQFAKTIPNIDPTRKLFLGLGYDREHDRQFLYVKQDGSTVHAAFTKDNPGDCPPPVKKTIKGVTKWDFEEQEDFLYNLTVDFFAVIGDAPAPVANKPEPEEDDSIPF